MRRIVNSLAAAGVLLIAAPNVASANHHEGEAEAAGQHYTTSETPLGTLTDDPDALAVLELHIPRLIANEQIKMARQITLKDIQGFAPDALSDEILAAIDADLAELPAK